MDHGFWKQLCNLCETKVDVSLLVSGKEEPAYQQNIDLSDI
jgi:hypothetical protein